MIYHKLLLRQMSRYSLSANQIPGDAKSWQEFIESVNRTYTEADQERYLLERSTELSSNEMKLLNKKLEEAQTIARMGNWSYDTSTDKMYWSKELYRISGLPVDKQVQNLESLYQIVHEGDVQNLRELINNAIAHGAHYECEIRMREIDPGSENRWYRIICRPEITKVGHDIKVKKLFGVMLDVTCRKQAEEELKKLHQQLITSARRAGMADVATSMLHNVGNILNSANVSIGLINEKMNNPYMERLHTIKSMIESNIENIGKYFSNDPKGKLIPPYLINLSSKLSETFVSVKHELANLSEQLKHIKEITTMQKNVSGISDMVEKIFLPDVVDTAIMMSDPAMEAKHISVIKSYTDNVFISTDRSKLLQILVNLIQNAKDSLMAIDDGRDKLLSISVEKVSHDRVVVRVQDNGIGIAKNTLKDIFVFGFTTKTNGHGFGLHSSALAASELNGALEVSSEGVDKGAIFTLNLPLTMTTRSGDDEKRHEFENNSH